MHHSFSREPEEKDNLKRKRKRKRKRKKAVKGEEEVITHVDVKI